MNLFLLRLRRPYRFQTPVPGKEYAAWVLSNDTTQTDVERQELSAALVATGCRYAVCSGHESSKWDDSIDIAFLETAPDFDPPEERFVMTTWHDHDPLPEVARFFVDHTSFDLFEPDVLVIVAVGDGPETAEAERLVRMLLEEKLRPDAS